MDWLAFTILALSTLAMIVFIAWDIIKHPSTPESRAAFDEELDDHYREMR